MVESAIGEDVRASDGNLYHNTGSRDERTGNQLYLQVVDDHGNLSYGNGFTLARSATGEIIATAVERNQSVGGNFFQRSTQQQGFVEPAQDGNAGGNDYLQAATVGYAPGHSRNELSAGSYVTAWSIQPPGYHSNPPDYHSNPSSSSSEPYEPQRPDAQQEHVIHEQEGSRRLNDVYQDYERRPVQRRRDDPNLRRSFADQSPSRSGPSRSGPSHGRK